MKENKKILNIVLVITLSAFFLYTVFYLINVYTNQGYLMVNSPLRVSNGNDVTYTAQGIFLVTTSLLVAFIGILYNLKRFLKKQKK